ncbi:hypothetical protein V6N13_100997 [Hibiscus sabdariffa]
MAKFRRWVYLVCVVLTAMYASPNATIHKGVWDRLADLKPSEDADFVFDIGLLEVVFHGGEFTWKHERTRKHLDHCLFNEKWFLVILEKELLARLRVIDKALCKAHSDFLVQLDLELRAELDETLRQEESLWLHNSRV